MPQRRVSSAKSEADAAKLWDLTPEQVKSYEKATEIEVKSKKARWKLRKDMIVTWAAVVILAVALAACLIAIVFPRDPRETQPAWAILSSIVAGVFSYLAGKAAR